MELAEYGVNDWELNDRAGLVVLDVDLASFSDVEKNFGIMR